MRADRLLRIVFRLQGRGVIPASTLARDLQVSSRTIRRDMEALSAAGVPVYSIRGGAGGWALEQDYRTSLTGLSTTEALAMIVGQPRGILSDLGLDDPGDDLILKLLAAVAPAAREHAEHARQRIHIDPRRHWEPVANDSSPLLPHLLTAIWDDQIIELHYGSRRHVTRVAPYGLVRKGTRWYLVGHAQDMLRMYRVSRIHGPDHDRGHLCKIGRVRSRKPLAAGTRRLRQPIRIVPDPPPAPRRGADPGGLGIRQEPIVRRT